MNKKNSFGAIILLILIIITGLYFVNTYESFHIRAEDGCEEYYEKCTCVGLFDALESYPPQYECAGYKFCEETKIIKCE